jgi:hypothetical protein
MTAEVVDVLEAVEIDVDDRHFVPVCRCLRQQFGHVNLEGQAIRQARQRVVVRQIAVTRFFVFQPLLASRAIELPVDRGDRVPMHSVCPHRHEQRVEQRGEAHCLVGRVAFTP